MAVEPGGFTAPPISSEQVLTACGGTGRVVSKVSHNSEAFNVATNSGYEPHKACSSSLVKVWCAISAHQGERLNKLYGPCEDFRLNGTIRMDSGKCLTAVQQTPAGNPLLVLPLIPEQRMLKKMGQFKCFFTFRVRIEKFERSLSSVKG
ncbi:hypothetical protein BTVI_131674 [Pitangus sulphuratus]|nr:hypothetical protein BTVI_131674 [Pitangus sulphuratus]